MKTINSTAQERYTDMMNAVINQGGCNLASMWEDFGLVPVQLASWTEDRRRHLWQYLLTAGPGAAIVTSGGCMAVRTEDIEKMLSEEDVLLPELVH